MNCRRHHIIRVDVRYPPPYGMDNLKGIFDMLWLLRVADTQFQHTNRTQNE
jgi:hypothetical protein